MHFIFKRATILLVLAYLSLPAFAETTRLTIDQAVAEAKTANLTLKDSQLKTSIKERDKNLALNKFYPTVSVGTALTNFNDMYTYKDLKAAIFTGTSVYNYYYTPKSTYLVMQLNAQFILSWSIIEAIKQTGIDYENSRIAYDMAQQKLERDVRKAFFQLLVFQETIRVTEKQLANAEERYQQALSNQQAGQSAKLSVLQAKVAWDNKKPGLEDLKVNYNQLLFGFENLLGRDSDPKLELEGALDIPLPDDGVDVNAIIEKFLYRRLDVQAAEGQIRAADGMVSLQQSQLLPVIGVQYTADPMLNDPLNTSWSDMQKSSNWYQKNGALTLLVSWKLDSFLPWSGFINQNADIHDQTAQARNAAAGVKLLARSEVMTLFDKINKSRRNLSTLQDNVNSALEAYNLTEAAYKTGIRNFLEVQDAEVQYQFAQIALLNEKQQLNSSLLDLQTALNTPISEIFQKSNETGKNK